MHELSQKPTEEVNQELNTNSDALLTREEVAKYLNVTERTVLDWAQREIIPAIKLAGSWRFRRQDIELWVEFNRTGPELQTPQDDNAVISPQPFRSEERERKIKSCVSAIELSMQNTDREEWPVFTFHIDHGSDIANEAIARLIKTRNVSLGTKRANGEKYEVIKWRKA